MAPGRGYDADLPEVRRAAGRLIGDGITLGDLGGQAVAAASHAATGVAGGPLTASLEKLAERLRARAGDLAQAVEDSSRAVGNCATTYGSDDARTTSAMMATFAEPGGSSDLAQVMAAPFVPKPPPDPNAPPVLVPGLIGATGPASPTLP